MADAPLPTVEVTGQPPQPGDYVNPDEFWVAYNTWLASLYQSYSSNWASYQPGAPLYEWDPPREDPELPEVVVTGERPPIGEREFPIVVSDFETHDMNDQELADYYGGGDYGYETMWRERHPSEPLPGEELLPDESFAPPIGLLYPLVGGLTTLGRILLGGFAGLFVPSPAGPRELDEAPAMPPRPPRTPLPPFTDPILPPNWEDIANEPYSDWIDIPDIIIPIGDPVPRRLVPELDTPGVPFLDPVMPEFPEPDYFPRSTPVPRPGRPSTFPYSDPTPTIYADPFGNPFAEPYFWPNPEPTERPGPFPDPLTDAPPRIGDPVAPPTVLPPRIADPIFDPTRDPNSPFDPVRDPFDVFMDQPLPQDASNCDCTKTKKKKKKGKSKPRSICYEGHYVEHSRGLTKVRGKEIPCDTKATRTRTPRKKSPSLPDLAKDIFGLPT